MILQKFAQCQCSSMRGNIHVPDQESLRLRKKLLAHPCNHHK